MQLILLYLIVKLSVMFSHIEERRFKCYCESTVASNTSSVWYRMCALLVISRVQLLDVDTKSVSHHLTISISLLIREFPGTKNTGAA